MATVMDWPPQSKDCNIFETVRDHLDKDWNKKAANIQRRKMLLMSFKKPGELLLKK